MVSKSLSKTWCNFLDSTHLKGYHFFSSIFQHKGKSQDLVEPCFPYTFYANFMPPVFSGGYSSFNLYHFLARCAMVNVRIHGSSSQESFLYYSGEQISLLSKKTFIKIRKDQRSRKIDLHLSCSGVSGSKLKLVGCYLIKLKMLGKDVVHPFFLPMILGMQE